MATPSFSFRLSQAVENKVGFMSAFRFSRTPIDTTALRAQLADPSCGGYASFEGLVRNHNEGMSVRHLEYEAFEPLAVKEGERIISAAVERFGITHAACVHRIGDLAIGEMAVWVGVSARHRDEAFRACRYIIDEVKHRVPIWKKEHYENGDSGWVNCERCAVAPFASAAGDAHDDAHDHAHAQGHAHHHDHAPSPAPHAGAAPSAPTPDYSRQIALKEVGQRGQAKLRASRVLVLGCGGLGVPVISYLAGAGIGRLGLVDGDRLEASNLHRQTMYALADVGKLKAELAAARVRALNPEVEVDVHAMRFTADNALDIVGRYDLVIDCTDNFSTKFLLNDVCVQKRVPVVFSSVYQYEGQLQVVRPDRGGPCLRCLWPEATRDGIVGNCAEAGVLGPVPGTFGSLQAFEALKLLLDLPGQLGNELLVFDLLTLSISRVRAKRAANCPEHAQLALAGAQARGTMPDGTIPNGSMPNGTTPLEVAFESLDEAAAAGFEIVDVREPRELAETPTPAANARHIPLAELLYGKTANLKAGDRTLLVCASGRRSLAAAQELRSRGLAEVYSLRGGINQLLQHAPA
jgi:molybdopterin/thiamine biosynthesis adenylyltransferase/molybdopterin synthase catalytic subunit/rhodanese-related sulfurtransferase